MTHVSNEMSIDIDSTTSVLTIGSLKPNTLYKISFKIKWKKGSKFLLVYTVSSVNPFLVSQEKPH